MEQWNFGIKWMVLMGLFGFFGINNVAFVQESKQPLESIYDIRINRLEGGEIDLAAFRGKKLLIVNVASKCGFTHQYIELQKLHEQFGDRLVIIGVPCNQFMNQEPGDAHEIANFCSTTYNVTFPMTEKVNVKGRNQHALYQWLTDKRKNGTLDSKVKWNFQKYLIDEKGVLLQVFPPNTSPLSDKITSLL